MIWERLLGRLAQLAGVVFLVALVAGWDTPAVVAMGVFAVAFLGWLVLRTR